MTSQHNRNPEAAWRDFVDAHGAGDVLTGTVVSVVSFGVFVEVAPDVEGLLHESVLEGEPNVGDVVAVRVEAVDPAQRRMSLAPA